MCWQFIILHLKRSYSIFSNKQDLPSIYFSNTGMYIEINFSEVKGALDMWDLCKRYQRYTMKICAMKSKFDRSDEKCFVVIVINCCKPQYSTPVINIPICLLPFFSVDNIYIYIMAFFSLWFSFLYSYYGWPILKLLSFVSYKVKLLYRIFVWYWSKKPRIYFQF